MGRLDPGRRRKTEDELKNCLTELDGKGFWWDRFHQNPFLFGERCKPPNFCVALHPSSFNVLMYASFLGICGALNLNGLHRSPELKLK